MKELALALATGAKGSGVEVEDKMGRPSRAYYLIHRVARDIFLQVWSTTTRFLAFMAPTEPEPDAYEILGLTIESTEKDIRSAYRKLSLKVHPDRVRIINHTTNKQSV